MGIWRTKQFPVWGSCLVLETERLQVAVTLEWGPRICLLAGRKGRNFMSENPLEVDVPGIGTYKLRGGHRLWRSPEVLQDTYIPDESPVRVETGTGPMLRQESGSQRAPGHPEGRAVDPEDGSSVCSGEPLCFVQQADPFTGVEKALTLWVDDQGDLRVGHRLTNRGHTPLRMAAWAITALRPGGTGLILTAFQPKPGFQPDRSLVLWPYTDLADERIRFRPEGIWVRAVSGHPEPLKIGWQGPGEEPLTMAYLLEDEVFVKSFDRKPGSYPDLGVSGELYTDGYGLELESLSALETVEPGGSVFLTETWKVLPEEDFLAGCIQALPSAGIAKPVNS